MICVNLGDGRTEKFDLELDGAVWSEVAADSSFQQSITGIGILHDGRQHMLPVPKGFRSVDYFADLAKRNGDVVGEYVGCQIDDIEVRLTVYREQGMARVDIVRVGRKRVSQYAIRRSAEGNDKGNQVKGSKPWPTLREQRDFRSPMERSMVVRASRRAVPPRTATLSASC